MNIESRAQSVSVYPGEDGILIGLDVPGHGCTGSLRYLKWTVLNFSYGRHAGAYLQEKMMIRLVPVRNPVYRTRRGFRGVFS